ncbi:hypothetical protein RN001_010579 [Aquatica leii]|uniref:Uncharacterized protein n=1 Tax=Aquatica leii TaxID=1421715 RepID=A0AAN7QHK1_9COLE|nr:hypothetical protein RN001_010579 [Aquatica leii]
MQDEIVDFYISQFGVSDVDFIPSAPTAVLSTEVPSAVPFAEVPATSLTGVTVTTTAVSLPPQTLRFTKSKATSSKLRLPYEDIVPLDCKSARKEKRKGSKVHSTTIVTTAPHACEFLNLFSNNTTPC